MCEWDRSDVMAITSESPRAGQCGIGLGSDEFGMLLGYVRLPARAELVRDAREFVRLVLRSGSAKSSVVEDVELIVSELVTNVVQYCARIPSPTAVLKVSRLDASLRIEVHDPFRFVPAQRTPSADDEGGRGLTIVDALSDRWGHEATAQGKFVWCELTAWPDETADQSP